MKRFLSWALPALLAGTLTAATTETERHLWDAWRGAYAFYEDGENLLEKGDTAAALKAFRKAAETYEKIAKLDPKWNEKIVRNRIVLASQAVARLEQSASGTAISLDALPLPRGEAALKQALSEARTELTRLRAANAEAKRLAAVNSVRSEDIESLMKDNRAQEDRIAVLEKRVAELNATVSAPDKKNAELQKRLLLTRAQLDLTERKLTLADQKLGIKEAELQKTDFLRQKAEFDCAKAIQERDQAVRSLDASRKLGSAKSIERDDYASELKDRDQKLSAAEQEVANLRADNQKLEARIAMMRKGGGLDKLNIAVMDENRDMKTKLRTANARVDELAAALKEADAKRLSLQKSDVSFRDAVRDLTKQLKSLETANARLKSELEKEIGSGKLVRVELENLRGVNQELKDSVASLHAKNAALSGRLDTSSKSGIQTLEDLNAKLKKLTEANAALLVRHDMLNSRLSAAGKTLADNRIEHQNLRGENTRLKQENAGLLKSTGSSEAVRNEIDSLKKRCAELDAATQALRVENAALRRNGESVSGTESVMRKSLLDAARAAERDKDTESAVWYYGELLKLEPGQKEFAEKLDALKKQLRTAK